MHSYILRIHTVKPNKIGEGIQDSGRDPNLPQYILTPTHYHTITKLPSGIIFLQLKS